MSIPLDPNRILRIRRQSRPKGLLWGAILCASVVSSCGPQSTPNRGGGAVTSGRGAQRSGEVDRCGSAASLPDARRELYFSENVPTTVREMIVDTPRQLQALPADAGFRRLTTVMGTDAPCEPSQLWTWMLARSHFLLTDAAVQRPPQWRRLASGGRYVITEASGPEVVAENLGTVFYLNSRNVRQLAVVPIAGSGDIEVTSPRVGILSLREFGLRSWQEIATQKGRDEAWILAFSTLLHESRHADGRGVHVGLQHRLCPERMGELSGHPACDRYSNGAYAVQSLFLNWVTAARAASGREVSHVVRLRRVQADLQAQTGVQRWLPGPGEPEFEVLNDAL